MTPTARVVAVSMAVVILATLVVLVWRDVRDVGCAAGRCIVVEDDDETSPLGVQNVGHVTANGYASICRVVVRRRAGVWFSGATVPSTGDVTILDGALGRIRRCTGELEHTRAIIDLNPDDYAWAIPGEGNVFVPFDSNDVATLEDGASARAVIEEDADGAHLEDRYCVVLATRGERADARCGVRIGNAFQ
jgi:hypothetical protein